jgi:hypothetical protein
MEMACFSQNGGEFFPKTFFQKTDRVNTIPIQDYVIDPIYILITVKV